MGPSRRLFLTLLSVLFLAVPALRDGFAQDASPARPAGLPSAVTGKIKRAVLAIHVEYDGKVSASSEARSAFLKRRGAGVVIAPNGIILTVANLLAEAKRIQVITDTGWVYEATVLGVDAVSGLAVLKIQADKLKAVYIKPLRGPKLGEELAAIGCLSDGRAPDVVLRHGKVASAGRIVRKEGGTALVKLELDTAMPPDFLGAAVYNASGDLVGIVQVPAFSLGQAAGCVIVPINKKTHAVAGLLQAGRQPQYNGVLGLAARTELEKKGECFRRRLVVRHVMPGGPAGRAGLREGDRIVAADGIPLGSVADLRLVLSHTPVNTPLELTLEQERDKKKFLGTIEVVVRGLAKKQGSKPSNENP